MEPTLDLNIQSQLVVEGILHAYLYDGEVIEIIWNHEIKCIEVEHLSAMQIAVGKLGGGKKMPLYFTAHEFLDVSVDAQAYATSEEGTRYSLAIAVLLDSLAIKIDYNAFIKRNQPVVPTIGFTKSSEAIDWLKSQ